MGAGIGSRGNIGGGGVVALVLLRLGVGGGSIGLGRSRGV